MFEETHPAAHTTIEELLKAKPEALAERIARLQGYVYVPRGGSYSVDGWFVIANQNSLLVHPGDQFYVRAPQWVSDATAACELLEEIRRAGDPVCVLFIPENYDRAGRYEIKIYLHDGEAASEWSHVWADALPIAACIAYILWKENRRKPQLNVDFNCV